MEEEAALDRQDTAITLRVAELEAGLLRIKTMAIGGGFFRIADVADRLLTQKQPGVSER